MVSVRTSRRTLLKQLGLAGAALSVADLPGWVLPALAQGETLVPFTDIPATFNPVPSATNRTLDIRKIDGPLTPRDQFYTVQHYGHPDVDLAAFRLKVTGLVKKPLALPLDELKRMRAITLVAGFECSGNSPRSVQGLSSNGRWTGVPLKAVLDQAALKSNAREIVFFGADHGTEEVEWRTQKFAVEQQFGRSLTRARAMSAEPLLAYALNGEPLTKHQGAPLRVVVPGWYGVSNVKWLAQIHVQDEAYLGRFQARWYRTLRGETIDGETKWKETAIAQMRVKSIIARVTTNGSRYTVHGFVLSDGTPIKSVEVKVDEGPWQMAALDPVTAKDKYSWKLFTYQWTGAAPGPHTLVSRATDANGVVQPTAADLESKKSFLEDNAQFPRKLTIG
jgi:DMSO/TMAO reductase YedYZ molybdopterin-dependent catalytic subunit